MAETTTPNDTKLTDIASSSKLVSVQSDNYQDLSGPRCSTECHLPHTAKDSRFENNSGNDIKTDGSVNEPFAELRLSSHDVLQSANRMKCPGKCGKKRRYYCSECIIPLLNPSSCIPAVSLPLHIHILQAASESPQQSTAQHIPLLAPRFATIWRPYPECSQSFQSAVLDRAHPNSVALL